MKNLINLVIALCMISNMAFAKAEKWVIDQAHSKIGFEITHLIISTVEGKFGDFKGDINFAYDYPERFLKDFSVNVEIQATSIDTENDKRDDHLRSKDFFDVKKHKTLTFKSKKMAHIGGKKFSAKGDLTIAGKTKEVKLNITYLGSISAYDVRRIAFNAETKIDRKDFDLNWNDVVEAGNVVGDVVTIKLRVQAKRVADL